jgi:hypothetical protein
MMLLAQRYTFVSKLPPDVLIGRLQEQLGRGPSFFRHATKSYWGEIDDYSFKIEPSVISRRQGTAVIIGDISAADTGSVIQLLMREPVIAYIGVGLIIAACIFLLFLIGLVSVFLFLFCIIFPSSICVVAVLIFKYQVKTIKASLLNLFEAEEVL